MLDLMAGFFSKFIPPDCIDKGNIKILQISIDRDNLLHSLNILDDLELDFSVHLEQTNYGTLKILKTRELSLIQASCPFAIDHHVDREDVYVFPDNQLLIKTDPKKHLKTIKSIYSAKDVMQLKFSPEQLTFQNTLDDQCAFEINAKNLSDGEGHFGNYLSKAESQMASNFSINFSYKYLQGLVKLAEAIDGFVAMAMETESDEEACIFLFTQTNNLQYTIGVNKIRFQNLDALPHYS